MLATGICLLSLGGALLAWLEGEGFTLSWKHSVEQTLWQETWKIEPGGLVNIISRVSGTGAGMDPPEGSVKRPGGWAYRPALPVQARVMLAHTSTMQDYSFCAGSQCLPLGTMVGRDVDSVILVPGQWQGDGTKIDCRR